MQSSVSLTLRTAQLSDIPTCGVLDASYATEHTWQLAQERSTSRSTADLALTLRVARLPRARSVRTPDATQDLESEWDQTDLFLVAETDGVVGYACASVLWNGVWVRRVVVDTAHRRSGIGTSLLAATRKWAQESRFACLMAAAPAKNFPAISLLRASGYKICGYNERHYSSGEIAIYLALDLPDA